MLFGLPMVVLQFNFQMSTITLCNKPSPHLSPCKHANSYTRAIWMSIIGFTLWYVWKTHCLKVFQDLVHPPREFDHGYLVHDYQLPTRATGRDLQPLRQHGHCPLTLLAEMDEHANGYAMRKQHEVELPSPVLIISYSPFTHPPLQAKGYWPTMTATSL